MLAEMGEHQLMIRDYLRHSDLHVTNKYLQATTKSKRLAQGKLVEAILPGGVLSGSKSNLYPLAPERFVFSITWKGGTCGSTGAVTLIGPKRTQIVFASSL
jgi:hypothetical protein